MANKNNAFVSVKVNGNFKNIFVEVSLQNGEVFDFQVSPKFLSKKALYKLVSNLPSKE